MVVVYFQNTVLIVKEMNLIIVILIVAFASVHHNGNPREKSLKEKKVVGSYEAKNGEETRKVVLLLNGILEVHANGKKVEEGTYKDEATWKIVGKEVHVGNEKLEWVFKIESNGDLTKIAKISNRKREKARKSGPIYFKKLKE